MLDHDFECTCKKCFQTIEFGFPNSDEELRTAKIIELAEQEGGLKSYITYCLKQMPRYNQKCFCINNIGKVLVEDLGDRNYRDVCCVCGGLGE